MAGTFNKLMVMTVMLSDKRTVAYQILSPTLYFSRHKRGMVLKLWNRTLKNGTTGK